MAKGGNAKKAPKSLSLSPAREKSKMVPSVTAMNAGQKNALRAIASPDNAIVFLEGIAGTGKTFCAASWGLEQLLKGKFERFVCARPNVEAGEKLGFLPGDFDMKIAPFMIPIFETFKEHISAEDLKGLIDEGRIITLPLAYMRGVTFKKSFVLLDEAQNTTAVQMHLFLTRIGEGSKMVVDGDLSQSDLHGDNGFRDIIEKLPNIQKPDGVPGVEVVRFDPNCVVRHALIPAIDRLYADKR